MSQAETNLPLKPLDFSPNVKKLFKRFDIATNQLKSILESSAGIEDIVSEFTNNSSGIANSYNKAIEIMKLASQERKFTLTPLIAKYSKNRHSEEQHQLYTLLTEKNDIDHTFVNPISGAEGIYYHYLLYVPIPKDILEIDDPKKLLKEHWDLVSENIPKYFKNHLLKELEPLYTVGRVYGWDGAWLAYSATVIDKNNIFWSLPLVKSPFNGAQPFLVLKEGEFTILENDETEICKLKAKRTLDKIKERVKHNQSIDYKTEKHIEVVPEWIFAYNTNSNKNKTGNLINSSHDFGTHLGPASIESNKEISDSIKLLEFMKKDIIGCPLYEFTHEEIGKNLIHQKL